MHDLTRRVLRIAASVGIAAVLVGGGSVVAEPARTPPRTPVTLPLASAHGAGPVTASVTRRLTFRLPTLDGQQYTPNARNIAMRTRADGPLLLFLPATRAVPRDYRAFLDTAESAGYHVLGLDYWNIGMSVAQTCGARAGCYGDVQANRFDGSHPSRFSAIAKSDSILARLTHSLTMLAARDPSGGWDRYLSHGGIRWDRIVVAGHSQGGGESAFIAHRHRVQGALLFASPVATDGTVVARSLLRSGRTPMARYYGFDASGDVYFRRIQGSWDAMGLGGSTRRSMISDTIPVGAGRALVTRMPLGSPGESHSRLITDDGPRNAIGEPLFRPVWLWMLRAVQAPDAGS